MGSFISWPLLAVCWLNTPSSPHCLLLEVFQKKAEEENEDEKYAACKQYVIFPKSKQIIYFGVYVML